MAYTAKNGCVYRTFDDGRPMLVIAKFAPGGFGSRKFADPAADEMAKIAAAALNASALVSA